MTPVIFKWEKGEFPQGVAFFPTIPHDHTGHMLTCYAHTGQHSAADPQYVQDCRLAAPHEYAALLGELKAIGYDGLVVKRRQAPAYAAIRRFQAGRANQ